MAYINKIRKDGVIYDIQAQGGGSSDSEVTQEYIEELGAQLGRSIFPIKDIALYDNNSLVFSGTYEEFLQDLKEEDCIKNQSLYIDNRGGYFLLPKRELYHAPKIHIVEDVLDSDSQNYDKAFIIQYASTFDNDEHHDLTPFFLKRNENYNTRLNGNGQMVSIRCEYWTE